MAIRVRDKATQRVVEVPAAEAQRGALAGDYELVDKRVRFAEGNRTGSVDATELYSVVGNGGRLIDDEQAKSLTIRREESGFLQQAVATAEAAAAGATLGGSTWVEANMLGVDPERMSARREQLGGGAVAAELIGAAVPALLTGGGSAAGAGASAGARGAGLASRVARVTPAGLVERAGAATAEALAPAAYREAPGLARRILPMGARGFVEGAAGGVGMEIDESVLGDRDLTADRLLSAGIIGGAFGAGASVGLHGLARVAAGAASAPVKGMQTVLGRMNAATGGEATEAVAREAVGETPGLVKAWKWSAKLGAHGSASDEVVERAGARMSTDEGLADISRARRDSPKIQSEAVELVTQTMPRVHGAIQEHARRVSNGAAKETWWARNVPDSPEVRNASLGEVDSMFNTHGGHARSMSDTNAENLATHGQGSQTYAPHIIRAYDDILNATRRDIKLLGASDRRGRDFIGAAAMITDTYKRQLGQLLSDSGGWRGGAPAATVEGAQAKATTDMLKARYSEVASLLERRDLWGKAADGQADVNAAYARSVGVDDLFREATAGTGLSTLIDPNKPVNATKALKLVRAHGRVGGDVIVERLMDSVQAKIDYFDAVIKHMDPDPEALAAHAALKADAAAMGKEFKRQSYWAGLVDDEIELRNIQSGNSVSVLDAGSGILGYALGGPIGAVVGAGISALRKPYTSMHGYAAVMQQLKKSDIKIDKIADRVAKALTTGSIGKAARSVGSAARTTGAVTRTTASMAAGAAGAKARADRHDKALAAAVDIIMRPDALENILGVELASLANIAPGVSAVIYDRVRNAARFLQGKAPKVYQRGSVRLVDPVSLASFERYLEAVVDPFAALERVETGRLTREAAEAIESVYPALWVDIKDKVFERMAADAAAGKGLSYDGRMRMGQLFGEGADPSLVPSTGITIQAAIGADGDENADGPKQGNRPPGKNQPLAPNKHNVTAAERTADWKAQ